MTIAILALGSERPEPFAGRYRISFISGFEEILSANGLAHRRVAYRGGAFWDELSEVSHFIARPKGKEPDLSICHSIIPEIERRGIPCLPNYETFRHCGDKLKVHDFIAANGIPSPRAHSLFSKDDVEHWIADGHGFPVVAKLRQGAASRNVALIESERQLRALASRLFSNKLRDGDLGEGFFSFGAAFAAPLRSILSDTRAVMSGAAIRRLPRAAKWNVRRRFAPAMSGGLLLQEFVPGNSGDTRVTVIGGRAFCFRRGNRSGDFRASGSGIIDYNVRRIDERFVEMALAISRRHAFQTMAYDFIHDAAGQPVLIEMSYSYQAEAVRRCPGYFREDGSFVQNVGLSPQYYQLIDFLDTDGLAWPEEAA